MGENGSSKKPKLSRVVNKIGEISTLPQVMTDIMQVTAKSESGAAELDNILQADPAMTSKILQIANSSYYGTSQKIFSVKRAIVLLGFDEVKNIATAASVASIFKSNTKIFDFSLEKLWTHSLGVAICSKIIAEKLDMENPEELFTAGIMHDIGIIMEDQYLHDYFFRIIEDLQLTEKGLVEAEQTVLGFDHGMLGGRVARHWKLPDNICRVISFHHRPMDLVESNRLPTAVVYLADLICNVRKIGYVPTKKAEAEEIMAIL
ncbi:MAG: HDOD domain-containing protein, partial [Deltaproteobacteria bacterium]|nr:HDOD domain-containing protein [Deltaproteobacteria bacterium]